MRVTFSGICFLLIPGILLSIFLCAATADAQRRDYLTDEEIELVRDAQDIDLRIAVLTTAIDRRFEALQITLPGNEKPRKLKENWGEVPKGTRLELLSDIKKLLQKAIDDIDDVAARRSAAPEKTASTDKSEKQQKKDAQRFPNAVRHLAASAERYRAVLRNEVDKAAQPMEKGQILDSIEFCDQIAEAAASLPRS